MNSTLHAAAHGSLVDHGTDDEQMRTDAARDLGPGSLLWENVGDLRALLLIFRVGLLQNMHPAVSRALEQHSGEVFLKNPWNRLLRSLPPILAVIYGPDPEAIGRKVRDFHVNIKGNLPSGKSYHALDPEVYFWTHATFLEAVIAMREWFDEPLSEREQEQLYQESVAWYARYGLTMRPVPPTHAAFKRYWAEMLEKLEATPITDHALNLHRTPRPFESIPNVVWWVIDPMINAFSKWMARGTLPDVTRTKLGLKWTRVDAMMLKVLCTTVRVTFKLIPREHRYLPMVRRWRAEHAARATAAERA